MMYAIVAHALRAVFRILCGRVTLEPCGQLTFSHLCFVNGTSERDPIVVPQSSIQIASHKPTKKPLITINAHHS